MFEFFLQGVKLLVKGGDELEPDFDFPLFITLSVGLGGIFIFLLILTLYFTFFNNGQGSIFLGSNFNIPGEFDDEQGLINDEEEYLPKFSPFDKKAYLQGKQFQERFPPVTKALGTTLTEAEEDFIADRGIQAYQFIQPLEYGTSGQPAILIEDKVEITFLSIHEANSAILNYPLPLKTTPPNDVVYFEVKFFEKPEESLVSVGLVSKPYPLFRLPGYNKYSIAYESNGTIRVNQPFYSPDIWSKVKEGDVVGVGFRCKTGTIFFTHNGKKVHEVIHNVKFDLYPAVGSIGEAKVSVNLGQIGFVFIEANVKKWGFGSVFGTIGVPPAYGNDNDKVLDKGEELPPTYPLEEETFFGPSALLQQQASHVAAVEQEEPVTKPTKIISNPPSYSDEPKEELSKADADEFKKVASESNERLYERKSSAFDLQNNNDFEDAVGSSSADLNQTNAITEVVPGTVSEETTAAAKSAAAKSAAPVVETVEEQQQEQEEEQTQTEQPKEEASTTQSQSLSTETTTESSTETTTETTSELEQADDEAEIQAAASPAPQQPKSSSASKTKNNKNKKNNKKKKKKGKK